MKEIIFLVSGNGGTLKYVHEAKRLLGLSYNVVNVIADRECGAVEYARKEGLPFSVLKYNKSNTQELDVLIKAYPNALIVTNIHKILTAETLSVGGKFINLHYSLLPSFGGLIGMETVEAAYECNAQFIGSTCHELVEEVDAGKIVSQSVFMPNWNAKKSVYDTMFQSGCLNLMSNIVENEGEKFFLINKHNVELSKPVSYSLVEHESIMTKVKESI